MIERDRLSERAKTILNIELNNGKLEQLVAYADEMGKWEANLTAITEPEAIEVKHFLDSMSLLHYLKIDRNARIADIGTGAGFPGLVMKIIRPDLTVTLIESVAKKTAFLEHMIQLLGLKGIEVLRARAEEVGQHNDYREQYDWVVARAVAILPSLVEYMLPLCRVGGHTIAMKGASALAEVRDAQAAIETLGGKFTTLHNVPLPNVDTVHMLVVISKVRPTPSAFPRTTGVPTKRPIQAPE